MPRLKVGRSSSQPGGSRRPQQCGLVQAIAFSLSRDEDAQHAWVDHLAGLIEKGSERLFKTAKGGTPGQRLLYVAQNANLASYLSLSRKAIDAAVWLRRFAQIRKQREDASKAAS